jgi:hypothetical protein
MLKAVEPSLGSCVIGSLSEEPVKKGSILSKNQEVQEAIFNAITANPLNREGEVQEVCLFRELFNTLIQPFKELSFCCHVPR